MNDTDSNQEASYRKELERSRASFRNVVDKNPDGIIILDENRVILYVNERAVELLNRSREDLTGTLFGQQIAGAEATEVDLFRPGSEPRRAEMRTVRVEWEGKPAHLLSLRDVTEARRAERVRGVLQSLAQKLTAALGVKKVGRVLSAEARKLFNHDAFFLNHYDPETDVLKGVYGEDTPPGENRPRECPVQDVSHYSRTMAQVASGKPVLINRESEKENNPIDPFGEDRVSMSLIFVPVRWEEKIIGVMSVQSYVPHRYANKDVELMITFADHCGAALARELSEEKLARLAAVVEQAWEIIVMTDVDGKIRYVNPAFEKITGYSREECLGENPRILKSGEHDEAFYKRLWNTILSGRTWRGRFINRKKDGDLYVADAAISPVRHKDGQISGFVKIERDVTEEIKREEQLRQSQKMEAVGQLAGGVAHDFNNMLQAILGYGDIAKTQLREGLDCGEALDEIRKAGEKSAELTRQLLAFGRRQPLSLKIIDLNDRIGGVIKMIRRMIPENIELHFIPGHGLKTANVDPVQIDQALMNLCVNARDAMPEGGEIVIRTEAAFLDEDFSAENPLARPGEFVMLSVTDEGEGMSEETLAHIFEPFFTTKERGKGTGLGLATVYGIIRQHRGFITAESRPGEGSVFRIYLPAADEAESSEEALEEEEIPGGSETLLIAEDEVGARQVARLMLEKAGYKVYAARNGEEALELLKEKGADVDLALLDVIMPKIGGRELSRYIQKTFPGIKVLFSSGYAPNDVRAEFEMDESVNLIQKPYSREDLLRRVRKFLDARS